MGSGVSSRRKRAHQRRIAASLCDPPLFEVTPARCRPDGPLCVYAAALLLPQCEAVLFSLSDATLRTWRLTSSRSRPAMVLDENIGLSDGPALCMDYHASLGLLATGAGPWTTPPGRKSPEWRANTDPSTFHVRVWKASDVLSEAPLTVAVLKAHKAPVTQVAFAKAFPDDVRLASASSDSIVLVWQATRTDVAGPWECKVRISSQFCAGGRVQWLLDGLALQRRVHDDHDREQQAQLLRQFQIGGGSDEVAALHQAAGGGGGGGGEGIVSLGDALVVAGGVFDSRPQQRSGCVVAFPSVAQLAVCSPAGVVPPRLAIVPDVQQAAVHVWGGTSEVEGGQVRCLRVVRLDVSEPRPPADGSAVPPRISAVALYCRRSLLGEGGGGEDGTALVLAVACWDGTVRHVDVDRLGAGDDVDDAFAIEASRMRVSLSPIDKLVFADDGSWMATVDGESRMCVWRVPPYLEGAAAPPNE